MSGKIFSTIYGVFKDRRKNTIERPLNAKKMGHNRVGVYFVLVALPWRCFICSVTLLLLATYTKGGIVHSGFHL